MRRKNIRGFMVALTVLMLFAPILLSSSPSALASRGEPCWRGVE